MDIVDDIVEVSDSVALDDMVDVCDSVALDDMVDVCDSVAVDDTGMVLVEVPDSVINNLEFVADMVMDIESVGVVDGVNVELDDILLV